MMKMTLIGLSEYMETTGDDLFQYASFPAGVDRDLAIDTILMKSGELPVLYTDPVFMQRRIAAWSKKYTRTFERWVKALSVDYSPLENYDRTEEWSDNTIGSADSTTDMSTSSDGSNTNRVSAYNSSDFENDAQGESESSTSSSSTLHTGNENNVKHTGRVHGNIGVTTSQQMLTAELDIARWNLYENIADLFMSEFIIMVY